MSTALTEALGGRPRRRRPIALASAMLPEDPPPPPWDLSMVRLPRWFMPMLRDLMEVAERSFGPGSGGSKRYWVEEAALTALVTRPKNDPDDFAPPEFQRALVDLLIEGIWGLQFRRPSASTALAEAVATLKASGRLRRIPDNDPVTS